MKRVDTMPDDTLVLIGGLVEELQDAECLLLQIAAASEGTIKRRAAEQARRIKAARRRVNDAVLADV